MFWGNLKSSATPTTRLTMMLRRTDVAINVPACVDGSAIQPVVKGIERHWCDLRISCGRYQDRVERNDGQYLERSHLSANFVFIRGGGLRSDSSSTETLPGNATRRHVYSEAFSFMSPAER